MCAVLREIKFFQAGGLNSDDAIEYRPKNDFFPAYNIRTTGTQSLEEGYITNIPSNLLLSASVAPGINYCIGSAGFESARIGIAVYYNAAGNNSIREINYDTNEVTVIPIKWPFNPGYFVNDIKLINNQFLLMNDNYNPTFYVDYNLLKAGVYDPLPQSDLMLIKAQPQYTVAASYGNDASRSVNLIASKEFQFRSAWVGLNYEASCVSTISERFVPPYENTPGQGADVTQNNNLTLSADAGTASVSQLLIDARYADLDWFNILTIDRSQILTLPESIDISNQIYQAYDPVSNQFSFVFYNDGLYENVPVLQTDQLCDAVPLKAGALEILNGNQVALADVTVGYPRPKTRLQITSTTYNPNLTLSPSSASNPLEYIVINPGQSGSGEGDHKRLVVLEFGGNIEENDYVIINLVDIRNSSNVQSYRFPPCTFGDIHRTQDYISSNSYIIPSSSTYIPSDGQAVGLSIITTPYFTLQGVSIVLYNAGAGIFKSIAGLKGNSSYQVCMMHYDFWGRPFPIQTDASYIIKTQSYGQSHGNTPVINWNLPNAAAPDNAFTYQFGISPNSSHLTWLFSLASIVQVTSSGSGTYNAGTNTFSPSAVGALAGYAWRVNASGTQTLSNGPQVFNVNDWVVAEGNGQFVVVPSTYGDLSDTTNYYFYFNGLQNYNNKFNSSILSYDYTPGDRCTLYYYDNAGVINWFDGVANPIIDVQVEGYDASVFFLKVNRAKQIDPSVLLGHNVLLELYTPKPRTSTTEAGITTNNPTVFFETGQVYKIANGQYQTLSGSIFKGDCYFKTRQIGGSVDPNKLYSLVVEDPDYSDFYVSKYYSFGRPRSFSDVLEDSRQIANIVYSQTYIFGSKNNGLTTFYQADVYGNAGGETSSNYGAIVVMAQINNELLVVQEDDHGTIPVYINILEDQSEAENVAISEKILNNIRYTNGKHIGIGKGRKSFALYNNVAYWIDSNRNEPIRWSGNGAIPISEKMSKYFRQTLQIAYAARLQPIGWYDIYNDEYVVSIPEEAAIPKLFAFSADFWQYLQNFSVLPAQIVLVSSPLHSSPSYNNITGICVITPSANYVGSDSFKISFPESPSTVNVCYNWTSGSGTVYAFSFAPVTGAPLSMEIASNTISVGGNDYTVPISITGGEYSINGGAWVSSAGTVNNGDIVQVRQISSGSGSTTTTATLTIDSQSANFNVTTAGSSSPSTININNTTSDFTIAFVKVFSGATLIYSQTSIGPGGSFSSSIPAGTYDVNVKILSSTDGGTGHLTIDSNGSPTVYTVSSFGLTTTQSGVNTSIIVELDP